MKEAWKAALSTTSTAATRARERTREVYPGAGASRSRAYPGARASRSRRRVAPTAAALLAVCVPIRAAASASEDTARAPQRQLERTARASAALGLPVAPVERTAALRLLAHFGARDPQPHLAALREIEATHLPAAAFALVAALADPGFPERAEAARALAAAPHRVAIAPLLAALDDADPRLRAQAALALGSAARAHVAPEETFAGVGERLRDRLATDPSPAVRFAAFDALLAIGGREDFVAAFRLTARDGDPLVACERLRYHAYFAGLAGRPDGLRAVREQALRILAPRGSGHTPTLLARALTRRRLARVVAESSPCPDLEVAAVQALDHVEDRSATPLLARLARSAPDPPLRGAAVRALRRQGGDAAFAAAQRALLDERWSVRRSGIEALGQLDEPRSADLLASRLARGSPLERQASARALAEIPAGSEALVAAFGDSEVQVRVAAEEALLARPEQVERLAAKRREAETELARWRAEQAAAERALAAALGAPEERVRRRAARILARYPGGSSLASLLEALRAGREPAASSAALALGLRGDPVARSALEGAAGSADPGLALASRRALRDLGAPAAPQAGR